MLKFNKSKIIMAVALSGGLAIGSILVPKTGYEIISAESILVDNSNIIRDVQIYGNTITGRVKENSSVRIEEINTWGSISTTNSSALGDFNLSFLFPLELGMTFKITVTSPDGVVETTIITYGTPSTVAVYYQDDAGNNLYPPMALSGFVGQIYNASNPPQIAGYILWKTPSNTVGGYTSENQSVVYVYKKYSNPTLKAKDIQLYVGDTWKVEDSFISSTDFFGTSLNSSNLIIDSNVDTSTAGIYAVKITLPIIANVSDVELTQTSLVTVLDNKQSIDGSDFTMTIGDKTPEASDFQATATDKGGNTVEVTMDLSQADINTSGTYDVILTSADGQAKTVKLTVKEKSNIVDDNNNNKDEVVTPINPTAPSSSAKGTKVTTTKTSPTSDSVSSVTRNSYSDESLPTTGEKDSTSAIVAGILLIVIALLTFGFLKKKKK